MSKNERYIAADRVPLPPKDADVLEQNCLLFSVDRNHAPAPLFNAQAGKMTGRFAQVGAGLIDIAFQQIGNGHP